jgi:hypothetical protein
MRRVECSMTAKTYRRVPVRVWVSKKSLREQCVGLAAKEVGPRRAVLFRRGRDAVLAEDLPEGGCGDLDAEGREFTVDPAIPP